MAKKKKEVVEQVTTNEIQEDIIDMMKEVSMQPEVDVPTDEEVIDAVSQHVRARGLSLSPEVVLYVLHRFTRDMGTLMQVIDCIDRYALQHKRHITVALVREMISARSRLS